MSWKFKIDQKASYLPPPDPVESKPADGAPQPAPAPETVMVNKAS